MTANSGAIIATFLVYLVGMLLIGLWAWRRTSDSSDYFLGGRSLGPWPSALSAGASDMSGWLLLGLPGYAFASGFEAFWLAGGLLVGTWLNWLFLAQRLRVYSAAAGNALTLPEFFTNRFRDKSGMLQVVSAFFILLFFLFIPAPVWWQAANCSKPCLVLIMPGRLRRALCASYLTPCLVVFWQCPGRIWCKGCLWSLHY